MIKLFDDDEQDKPAKQADNSLSSLNISPDPEPPAPAIEQPAETVETPETPQTPEPVADETAELPEALAQPTPPIEQVEHVPPDEPPPIEKVQEEPFATRVDEAAPPEPADPPIHTFEAAPVEEEPLMATGWNDDPKEEPWPSDPQPVAEPVQAETTTATTDRVAEKKPAYTPETDGEVIRNTGLAWSAGIIFFGSVVFMMFIGWGADLMLGTSPWGLVGGVILGSLIGFVQFFRISAQIFRK